MLSRTATGVNAWESSKPRCPMGGGQACKRLPGTDCLTFFHSKIAAKVVIRAVVQVLEVRAVHPVLRAKTALLRRIRLMETAWRSIGKAITVLLEATDRTVETA